MDEGFFVRVVLELLEHQYDFVFTTCSCCSTAERSTPGSLLSTVFLTVSLGIFDPLVGHKMFLRPVLVDLVDQFASSILTNPR